MTDKLTDYVSAGELIDWAMAQFNMTKPRDQLSDDEIRKIIRWLGTCAVDAILVEGNPIPGRIGIGLMLTVTLLEFPDYYMKYELAQFN